MVRKIAGRSENLLLHIQLFHRKPKMGLQDRGYYDNDSDPWSSNPDAWKGGGGGGSRRGPTVITILIIINVAIFLLDAFSPVPAERLAGFEAQQQHIVDTTKDPNEQRKLLNQLGKPTRWLAYTMGLPSDVISRPWKFWSVLTYGFAHSSIDSNRSFFHVGFNMLILFFLGRPVQQKYGGERFLRFYLMAIVVAGLGWVLLQMAFGNLGYAIGASGAVSGVVALFVFNFPHEKIYLWGVIKMPAWALGVLVVGGDMLTAMNPESHVAWEAHLIGFAFGAAYFYFGWKMEWMRFDWITALFAKSKPKLRVHDPEKVMKANEDLKRQADEILEKISQEGEGSLTSRERKVLAKYSKNLRKNRG